MYSIVLLHKQHGHGRQNQFKPAYTYLFKVLILHAIETAMNIEIEQSFPRMFTPCWSQKKISMIEV
jgi:hypothetical protein